MRLTDLKSYVDVRRERTAEHLRKPFVGKHEKLNIAHKWVDRRA